MDDQTGSSSSFSAWVVPLVVYSSFPLDLIKCVNPWHKTHEGNRDNPSRDATPTTAQRASEPIYGKWCVGADQRGRSSCGWVYS